MVKSQWPFEKSQAKRLKLYDSRLQPGRFENGYVRYVVVFFVVVVVDDDDDDVVDCLLLHSAQS